MKNTITYILSKTFKILFLYNVVGTSLGALVGIIFLSLQDMLATYCPAVGLVRGYGFIAFGILIFNIKPLSKKTYEDPKIELNLKYIREVIQEGNFSEKEKRAIWRKMIDSITNELLDDNNNDNQDDNNNVTD